MEIVKLIKYQCQLRPGFSDACHRYLQRRRYWLAAVAVVTA